MQDAVMMPLKVLRGHSIKSMEGVKNIVFHPKQPWIFSTGSDGKVLLWTWYKDLKIRIKEILYQLMRMINNYYFFDMPLLL